MDRNSERESEKERVVMKRSDVVRSYGTSGESACLYACTIMLALGLYGDSISRISCFCWHG